MAELSMIVLYNKRKVYCKKFRRIGTIMRIIEIRHMDSFFERRTTIMNIQEKVEAYLGKPLAQASNKEIYDGLLTIVQEMAAEKERTDSKKKLYYISAEFLIGKLLSNNMINLGIYQEVKEMLEKNGKDICEIEEVEPEPSLGNGGLGRLAACFLDSIATLGLAGDGIGLNYHLGLFKQEFENHLQKETPNPWIEEKSWLKKTDTVYPVQFKGLNVNARMYDIEVTGYNNKTNKLHLFDIDSVDESIVEDGSCIFLDGGTSIVAMLKYLEGKTIKIVTHSKLIVSNFQDYNAELFCIGGKLIPEFAMCTGPLTLSGLERFNFDYAFIGCAGIDLKRKLVYTVEMDTMAIKQKAMSLAKKSYLLADSSKFNVTGFCSFISTDDFEAIFSDNQINADAKDIPDNFILIDTNI